MFSIRRLILIVPLASVLLFSSCGKSDRYEISGALDLTNDSLHIQISDFSGVYAFSDFEPFDTLNNEVEQDLLLYNSGDTLILQPDTVPHYVQLVSGDSTKIVTITYFNMARENLAQRLNLLRQYSSFSEDTLTVPFQLTYSEADDPDLLELNQKYNLDSVAGNSDEITRIINLLNWANSIVRHDGSVDPADPDPKNALNIIATCNRENKGVNCRMMATILNEAYLATGFKSRHITCMPYDKEDQDCHVINIVYSEVLGKWLYVDPTFNGYFMDTAGYLLSVEEVRQNMIDGNRLFLPDDLNWNGEPKNKMSYINYMTKNLFRFSCPVSSEFGYESKSERAWVHLDPVGYDDEKVNTADTTKTDTKTNVDYYIASSKGFWVLP